MPNKFELQKKINNISKQQVLRFDQKGEIENLNLIQAQLISEQKELTTTVRLDLSTVNRVKRLAKIYHIKHHGRLLNMLVDNVLDLIE